MKAPRDAFPTDSFKWSAEICGAVVMGISLLGLVGWHARVGFLSSLIPGGIPMAPSTACSFLLSGTMLFFRTRGGWSAWVRAGAMVLTVFGLLNFLEPFIGVDLSFEGVLFPTTERFGAVLTNRMSPLTGLIFFLAGINLVLLLGRKDQAGNRHLGGFLGTLVALGGFIGTLGYLFGTPLLSGGVIVPMAFSTTYAFLLLGVGLMAGAGPDVLPLRLLARPLTQAKLLRAFLPLTVGAILFQGLMNKYIPALFYNYALGVVLVALLFAILTGVLVTIVARTLGLALDRAEATLRESENRYCELVRNANSAIIRWKCDGTITFFNEYAQDFFGYTSEEVFGRHVSILVPERESTGGDLTRLTQNILDHPERYVNNVNENICRDGRRTWMVWTNKPILDDYGQVLEILAIGSDVTERKRAEEAFQSLVSSAPIGIYIVQDGKFAMVNPGFEVITGYHAQELLGQHCLNQVSPEFRSFVREQALLRLKEEGLPPYEYQFITKNGETGWVMETVTPTQYQGKQAVMGYFMDISSRIEMEEQFLRAQKMEAVGTLAGGIAHDFNNILTAILGNIGLAALDDKIGPRVKDRLAQAEAACLRAQALSQQLLTFAKGGAPVKKLFSVAELLTESTAFACVGSPVKGETSFPENLWSIEADPGQIGQIFQNLTINAIHAMPTGGSIKVWAENLTLEAEIGLPLSAGKYIKISVRDQGIGIPAEHLPRIFDPYFTTKHKGSGLGLASAYAIVNKHHGHIAVESKPGVGTIFTIYLPAAEQQATPQLPEDRGLLVGTGKILVMDDEEMVREVLGRMLVSVGYEPEFARDGGEAIEMFVQAQGSGPAFAAVILDLTVPGAMGGKETMARLLEINPQVKTIVSSGYSDDPIMADFQKYGFSGVIAKPYRISELGKILHEVIMGKP